MTTYITKEKITRQKMENKSESGCDSLTTDTLSFDSGAACLSSLIKRFNSMNDKIKPGPIRELSVPRLLEIQEKIDGIEKDFYKLFPEKNNEP